MLELLMGPLNFKEHHKRCFDKQSWGKTPYLMGLGVFVDLGLFVCLLPFSCVHYLQNRSARRLIVSLFTLSITDSAALLFAPAEDAVTSVTNI